MIPLHGVGHSVDDLGPTSGSSIQADVKKEPPVTCVLAGGLSPAGSFASPASHLIPAQVAGKRQQVAVTDAWHARRLIPRP